MAVKKFKPITPSLREKTVSDFSDITTETPCKALTFGKRRINGRNSSNGRIAMRRRGGGHKRNYRIIDFKRDKYDIEGSVQTIEYDPNRTCRIALIAYKDGEKRYVIAPDTLKVGDTIQSGQKVKVQIGNSMPLERIPLGTNVHNIEMKIGKGGQLARSAGTFAQITAKEGDYCLLKLPSGEIRKIHRLCFATIGQVSNIEHENINIGKAGRNRWLGKRPKVRGVVMNPVDHPHGGGEGRTSGGRNPVTPWGIPTKGYKTRSKKKASSQYIISRRKK